jgi:hypothetical protein
MNSYFEKYIKYKNKYSELKEKILKMKGGNLSNLRNMLVMGAGPIGLLSTLALLTRYPYKISKDINSLDSNNIFLIGKENPWRPQIFFLQNSFREYNSIDFIRDIDLETYRQLEQIGCYIGSPPSTITPFCFSTYNNPTEKTYVQSALGADNTTIRAPSQIINDDGIMNQPMYLMHHLSFQVTDFETILLNRILEINQENINYYCAHPKFSEVEGKITVFIDRVGTNMFNLNCSIDLFKALVMKRHLISTNQISLEEFKPLVILLHPINRYCNINSFLLFKLYLFTDREDETIQFYKNNLKQEYISQKDENQTGNFFTNLWDVKVLPSGSIYLKTSATNALSTSDVSYCKCKNICTATGDIIFLDSNDYDLVFEAESKNKQFGSTLDYYCLKNRAEMKLENENKFDLKISPLLAKSLGKNHVIEVITKDKMNKYFLIIDKTISTDRDNIKIIFTVRELNTPHTNLHEMNLGSDNGTLEMQIPIKTISDFSQSDYDKASKNGSILNIFNLKLYDEIDSQVKSIINILTYLHGKDFALTLKYLNKEQKVTTIKKINTLAFEEQQFDLSKSNPDEDALVYASVWMFEANEYNNTMFYGTHPNYLNITKTDGKTSVSIDKIPLCSGPNCTEPNPNYKKEFTNTLNIKERIDKKSLPNQVYINNDQVQYFNNKMIQINNDNQNLIHKTGYSNNPQHVFRIFGVNLHKDTVNKQILNQKLKQNIDISSTRKFYYTGMQVSTEINKLLREFKDSNPVNNFKRHIILKNLYIISLLYSQDYDLDNYVYILELNNSNDINKLLAYVDTNWNKTYGTNKPDNLNDAILTPINETFATVFPITLRYKVNTIETQEINSRNKIIFNMGDSNTTVNFFSGTGLNTGILNVKKILTDYRNNLPETDINQLNKSYEKSNRRTIYNSLLSSQNSTTLSAVRNFKLDNGDTFGPYIRNISSKSFQEIDTILTNYEMKFNLMISYNENPVEKQRITNLNILLKKFNKFYELFVESENNKQIVNKHDPDFIKADIMNDSSDYNKILKVLKWNLFVCLYNLLYNPVLGNIEYEQESISYLNNMIYNYSDFCNFNRKEENKDYFCDVLENKSTPIDYDSTRSEGLLTSANFTT